MDSPPRSARYTYQPEESDEGAEAVKSYMYVTAEGELAPLSASVPSHLALLPPLLPRLCLPPLLDLLPAHIWSGVQERWQRLHRDRRSSSRRTSSSSRGSSEAEECMEEVCRLMLEQGGVDLVLDVGRGAYWTRRAGGRLYFPRQGVAGDELFTSLSQDAYVVSQTDVSHISGQLTFRSDMRASLPGQLHRISALRNVRSSVVGLGSPGFGSPSFTSSSSRHANPPFSPAQAKASSATPNPFTSPSRYVDEVYGLTLRMGKTLSHLAHPLLDLLVHPQHRNKNVLVLGRPGAGKTSLIRDITCVLSTGGQGAGLALPPVSVMVVDGGELGGDDALPHPSLGEARRMLLGGLGREARGEAMLECICNHTPDVLVVDEVAGEEDCAALRLAAHRGVRVVATTHGDLRSLLSSGGALSKLVGGVRSVTVGYEAAGGFSRGRKTRLERAGGVVFELAVELNAESGEFRVVTDVAAAVDSILAGRKGRVQVRGRESMEIEQGSGEVLYLYPSQL